MRRDLVEEGPRICKGNMGIVPAGPRPYLYASLAVTRREFFGTRRTMRMSASETGPAQSAAIAAPYGHEVELGHGTPLELDSGQKLGPFTVAYQTYGRLNADKLNAVMVCHALTGDQFVIGQNPFTGREGWWPLMVGAGLPLDTERYFIICVNVDRKSVV